MGEEIKLKTDPMPIEKLIKKEVIDYDKVFTYFPIDEILKEDIPFIHDYRMKGTKDEIASLPLSKAFKYKSFKVTKEEFESKNYPSFWA